MNAISADGLSLTLETYRKLKPESQRDILSAMNLLPRASPDLSRHDDQVASDDEDEDWVSFTEKDWRKFLEGVGPKVREFLEAVADEQPSFHVPKLLKKLGKHPSELRGVLAGLTKRTHTIAKNDNATLWAVGNDYDPKGYDHITNLRPETHAALRRALGKA